MRRSRHWHVCRSYVESPSVVPHPQPSRIGPVVRVAIEGLACTRSTSQAYRALSDGHPVGGECEVAVGLAPRHLRHGNPRPRRGDFTTSAQPADARRGVVETCRRQQRSSESFAPGGWTMTRRRGAASPPGAGRSHYPKRHRAVGAGRRRPGSRLRAPGSPVLLSASPGGALTQALLHGVRELPSSGRELSERLRDRKHAHAPCARGSAPRPPRRTAPTHPRGRATLATAPGEVPEAAAMPAPGASRSPPPRRSGTPPAPERRRRRALAADARSPHQAAAGRAP